MDQSGEPLLFGVMSVKRAWQQSLLGFDVHSNNWAYIVHKNVIFMKCGASRNDLCNHIRLWPFCNVVYLHQG